MANTVSFIIQLQDRFNRVAAKVDKSMTRLGKNAARVKKKIASLGKSFRALGGQAKNALALIATAFGAREFIRVGSGFQDAIADLQSITGTAGVELDFLSDASLRLAKSSKTAQDEVALAFTQIASAKSELLKDPQGLINVTEQVLLLANAAGIDVPSAVKASVGSLNQFNKGADDAARFVNVIAAGSKVGASLVGETAEALKNVGAVASQFNLSFEETNSLIQVLAKNEIKGAEAGTGLRQVLVKLEGFMDGKFAPSVIGIEKSFEAVRDMNLSNIEVTEDFGEEALKSIF